MPTAGEGDDLYRYTFPAHLDNGRFTSQTFDAGETVTWDNIS